MASIAVIGPGAIGGTLATWLHHTGNHTVGLCARRPLASLEVRAPGDRTLRFAPATHTDPAAIASPVDWILVATKAYDSAPAAAWFPGLLAPHTRVAILQNGVEHRERFAAFLPADRLVPVMVDLPCERTAPDSILQRAPGRLVVPDDAAGRPFLDLFPGTIFDVSATSDFKTVAWQKLCLNSAGILNALLLQPARIFQQEPIAAAARDIVRECVAVGRAEGASLSDEIPDDVLARCRRAAPDSVNSLHADRAAGRPMEIDARNGVIVRLGRRHGIPTPANQLAVTLLESLAAPRPA